MAEFLAALATGFAPALLLYSFIGVALGLFVGAVPGLNQGMIMALALPITFAMESLDAQNLLIGMYVGGVSGSMVSAILIGVPGTPAAVMTTFDGYPMAKQGQAARALALGLGASFVGGMISWLVLAGLSAPIARIAIRFSAFEFFAIITLGLVLIAAVTERSVIKGLLSGFLGMLFAMPGPDPVTGAPRLTFGYLPLDAGLKDLPVLLGIFAVGQIVADMATSTPPKGRTNISLREVFGELKSVLAHWGNLIRSSLIGTFVGVLPGIGANVGSVLAYSVARSGSREPQKFGTGYAGGIVASEAGNNATVCGALVPLITLGIPGSGADVFLLAALVLHNVQPGPLLIRESPETFYGIIVAALSATLIMGALLFMSIRSLGRIIEVPRYILVPVVLLFCAVGVYAFNNSTFDLAVLAFFGGAGLLLKAFGIPLAPFIIGFVLAGLAEDSLRSALMLSRGDFMPFLTRPVSAAVLAVSVLVLVLSLRRELTLHGAKP